MIKGDNFIVDIDNPYLPTVSNNLPGPAKVYRPRKIVEAWPEPWYNKFLKVKAIKLSDVVKIEINKMVVYRIIPHTNVSNNNKRLWKTIHKMYEMYESLGSRREREGFKFTFREKDYFWFDVIFKQEKGEKRLEFYVATSEFQAKKLKRKLENKMSITMKEADIKDLHVPIENTIVQEMKYLKHDIFSLNTNTNDTKTPISGLMNTIDELTDDGDMVRVSVCNEVENRKKWVKNAQWAFEKLSKGKVPQRATLNGGRVANGVKVGIAAVVNEINDLLVDTFQAFSNVFFKSEKEFKKEKVINKAHSIEDEVGTNRISHDKAYLPVFKSHIRIFAHSSDRLVRDSLSETPSLSLTDLTDTNELQGITVNFNRRRVEIIEEVNNLQLTLKTKLDANVNLISTDEMSKLALMMPNKELQRKYDDALSVKKKVETDIPSIVREDTCLHVGVSEYKDQEIEVGVPTKDKDSFYSGYTFIGKQGSGKDNLLQNFVREGNLNHGISFVIPDWICQEGHKGMADGIRDLIPPEKVIDLDLSNEEWIIPLDLTDVMNKIGRKGTSVFATEMVDFLNLGDLTRAKKILMEASKASGGSLFNIKRLIEDEEYRFEIIEQLEEKGNLRLAQDLMQWGDNKELGTKADPILDRLTMFFGDDNLYDIFAQPPKKEVDFEKWMKEGKVIIVRMPRRKIGNAAKVLVHWLTLKVLMTRMLMSEEHKEKHGCFMIFNEPEQVETRGLAELMGRIATEGRKERLGSIFAFHHWNKLPDYLQENLISGGVNQFLMANDNKKTFEKAKERLEPLFTVEQAMETPKHYSICLLNGKEVISPFLVHLAPPIPIEKRYDNSFLTKRHAQIFGRHWKELQQVL
ncbi:ATP-binding protein [Anaerobacillus alkalilacustris]|uniref:ATP-binding protein n=1 Tax=Anaerobacillus alkalilacustris TaxID=393763 RepID=A0A1S2LJU0_9BACI|nr:ATP-binding protein [Anaerobacillus alkalilacustris]OIJ12636.1 ATP-binding protein [Anaerobacillus alkalilacustris]